MAAAFLAASLGLPARAEWPVGTHEQMDIPITESNALSEDLKADPVHLADIVPRDETMPYREWDMKTRRFPNPDAEQRDKLMEQENLELRENRLRGAYGMGGTDYQGEGAPKRSPGSKARMQPPRFKPFMVSKQPGEPIGDSYERSHVLDNELRPGLMKYGGSTLKHYLANGQQGSWGKRITPDYPHIHPSVQVMSARPGDYEKISGADYLFKPPEIMPPTEPYLSPPHRPGEFPYAVPAERSNEYGHTAPAAYPEPPPVCIPAKDLPFMRAYTPPHLIDDYCVPIKYLPFYHPSSWGMSGGANPGNGGSPQPGGGGDSGMGQLNLGAGNAPPGADGPYFVAPPTPSAQFAMPMPFSHGPRFPAFEQLGQGGPPPQVPPPPPANYPVASLLNKAPPLPPPPMPPPMYPF